MKRIVIAALRRIAQLIAALLTLLERILLWPFLVVGLLLHREVFDSAFYAAEARHAGFRRRFPFTHFIFIGAWQLADPHPSFPQKTFARDYPGLLLRPPILNHVLNRNAAIDVPLVTRTKAQPAAAAVLPAPMSQSSAGDGPAAPAVPMLDPFARFEQIWPLIEADAGEIDRQVSSITPTKLLRQTLAAHVRVPPVLHSEESRALLALLEKMPGRVDHMLALPWLGILGGSEKVAERYVAYLRQRYPGDAFCIFVPDSVHRYSKWTESAYGTPIVSINEVLPDADLATRIRLFDRVMVNIRPKVLHNVNALTAWRAIMEHGEHYAVDTRIFLSLYSDIRVDDGIPVGYYHNYLPYVVDRVAGILCDNRTVMRRAIKDFAFSKEQAAKLHHVPTPMLGLNGGNPRRNLRRYTAGAPRRSLWMSRISKEKRIDVLGGIAVAMPERRFSVYGATLAVSLGADMTHLRHSNIDYRGEFESLAGIPVETFDSYVFTSDGEGMPLAVLEAIMLGLPVVAPDVGGIREMVDEDTGWLVSSSNAVEEYVEALNEIACDPEEAARRVGRAQERLVEGHALSSFMAAIERIPGYIDLGER